MPMLQRPKGQKENNVSEIEIYHTLGLHIIVQLF
jgi:hypothetical protein